MAAAVAAALLGFRHGLDYDHVAAIADLTAAARSSWRAIVQATLYGLGHALVVGALGGASVALGLGLPSSADRIVRPIVGLTLIALGACVLYPVMAGSGAGRIKTRAELLVRAWRWTRSTLWLARERSEALPLRAPVPGGRTALGLGMVHGIGAETPSQLALFVLAAGIGEWEGGLLCVAAFAAGLVAMNLVMAMLAAGVFAFTGTREPLYRFVMMAAGSYSIVLGAILVFGGQGPAPFL